MAVMLVVTVLVSALALAMATGLSSSTALSDRSRNGRRAAYIARAGLERTCAQQLRARSDWSGLPAGSLYADQAFGGGAYDVALAPAGRDTVIITARGHFRDSNRPLVVTVARSQAGGIAFARIRDTFLQGWLP
jgi:hypothetical protein